MFMEKPCPVFTQVLEDSHLLYIVKQGIFAAIVHDSAFARRTLAGLSMRLHGLIQDVEDYSLHSSTQRVIGFLRKRPIQPLRPLICPSAGRSSPHG